MVPRFLIAAAAAVAVLGGLTLTIPLSATGSTPAAGTLTDTSPPVSWTGGPFAVANVTGTVGTVDCTAPSSCDDFSLTVSTPVGTGDTKWLQISTSWANPAADFDFYVIDATGTVVRHATSLADPETVVLPPDSGTYTVRVVPFLPLDQSYQATASLVDAQPWIG